MIAFYRRKDKNKGVCVRVCVCRLSVCVMEGLVGGI